MRFTQLETRRLRAELELRATLILQRVVRGTVQADPKPEESIPFLFCVCQCMGVSVSQYVIVCMCVRAYERMCCHLYAGGMVKIQHIQIWGVGDFWWDF